MPSKVPELSEVGRTSVQCFQDSERWFGDAMPTKGFSALRHHVLALCGETGELANLIKKVDRGSLDLRDSKVLFDVNMELADIYTYVCNIAGVLGVDLNELYKIKRVENESRFGTARKERDAATRAGSNGG